MDGIKRRKFASNKLWRSKLINILESQHNSIVHWYKMNDTEFDKSLRLKLLEEADEVALATTKEDLILELADVFEVIDSLCKLNNISKEEVAVAKEKKALKSGDFEGRHYVSTVEHLPGSLGEKYCLADPKKYPEIID